MSSRGVCPVCGRYLAIKLVNNRPVLRRHVIGAARDVQCAGAGRPPVPERAR